MSSPGEIKAKKKQLILKKVLVWCFKAGGGFREPDSGHEMISITVGDPSFKASKKSGSWARISPGETEMHEHLLCCCARVTDFPKYLDPSKLWISML